MVCAGCVPGILVNYKGGYILNMVTIYQTIIKERTILRGITHKPRKQTSGDREGIDDDKVGLSDKVEEHRSISVGAWMVILESWQLTNSCIKISQCENHEPLSSELDDLHGDEVKQVLVPLEETVTLR